MTAVWTAPAFLTAATTVGKRAAVARSQIAGTLGQCTQQRPSFPFHCGAQHALRDKSGSLLTKSRYTAGAQFNCALSFLCGKGDPHSRLAYPVPMAATRVLPKNAAEFAQAWCLKCQSTMAGAYGRHSEAARCHRFLLPTGVNLRDFIGREQCSRNSWSV